MAVINKIKLPNNTTYDIGAYTNNLKRPGSINGIPDPTVQTLISTARANRLAFLPASQVIIEKTIDGGTTWTDAGISDSVKTGLFSETRPGGVNIPLIDGKRNLLCGLRITITAMRYNVPENTPETQKYNYWSSTYVASTERYTSLQELYFWVSSVTDSIGVKVEGAQGGSSTTWTTLFNNTSYGMTGWSGPDYISFSASVFGGSTSQTTNRYWNYRITLMTRGPNGSASELSPNSQTSAQSIGEIRGYGISVWTSSNEYMKSDKLYSINADKDATFPAKVTATLFSGSGASLTSLNGSNISSGTVAAARIADLAASKITSGTFDAARIPNLDWSKITSGKPTTLSGYGITDAATSGHIQAVNKGGTNITSYTTGDILYASGSTTLAKLAGNTTTTKKFLKSVATTSGTAVAPAWDTLAAADIPNLDWSKITSGKPTTIAGYGITDAVSTSVLGNYVSKSGDTVNGVLVANNFVSKYGVEFQNSSGTNVGGIFQDMEGANQFYMDEYTTSGVRECYLLPTPNATSTSFYDILTSKNAVTVAQGGTGATTAAGARTNLGLGSMATANTGDYVAKSGDTMTGNLSLTSGAKITTKSESIDITTTPSSTLNQDVIAGTDKNNNIINFMRSRQDTNGDIGVEFNARRTVGSSTYFNGVTFKIGTDGTRSISVSEPSAWCDAIGALPLSGGTMTGAITMHTTGLLTANAAGYWVNQYGNFTHMRTNANDTWGIVGANGDAFKVYYDSGAVTTAGTINAPDVRINNSSTPTVGFTKTASDTNANGSIIFDHASGQRRFIFSQRATDNGYRESYYLPDVSSSITAHASYSVLTTKQPVTAFKDMTYSISLASGTWTQQSVTQFTTPTGYVRTGISVVGGSTTNIRSYVYALTNANANWILLYNASGSALSGTVTLRAHYIFQAHSKEFTQ